MGIETLTGSASAVVAYWVHDLSPFIIRFSENFGIRWYGLSYVAGFLAGWALLRLYSAKGRSPFRPEQQEFIFIALFLGVIIGGRLGSMLFYELEAFLEDPLQIIRVWEGGMASHGGFIGVIIAVWIIAARTGAGFLRTGDTISTLAPPGLLFGRVANFINGELWGKITDVPWAVVFPKSEIPGTPLEWIAPRHPSQLYQAFLEGIVLLAYTQWRYWRRGPKTPDGQLAGEVLIAYAVVRIVGEIFREPDAALILGMSRGTFFSIFLALAGIVVIAVVRIGRTRQPGAQHQG